VDHPIRLRGHENPLLLVALPPLGKRPLPNIVLTNEMRVPPIPGGNEVSGADATTIRPVDETGGAETEGQVCEHFQRAAEMLGRRGNPQVIRVRRDRRARCGGLRRRVPGISDNLLSDRLKQLEAEGIVVRTVRGGRPVLIEYSLTEAGAGLGPAVGATGGGGGG